MGRSRLTGDAMLPQTVLKLRETNTATVTITNQDHIVGLINTDTTLVTVNLPLISTSKQFSVIIKDQKFSSEANPVTCNPSGSDLIEDDTQLIVSSNGFSLELYNDGVSKWYIK